MREVGLSVSTQYSPVSSNFYTEDVESYILPDSSLGVNQLVQSFLSSIGSYKVNMFLVVHVGQLYEVPVVSLYSYI